MGYDAHPAVAALTEEIAARSAASRGEYLRQIDAARARGPARDALGCSNLAHGLAACGAEERRRLAESPGPNIGIVTAYNDMLSAHQPYATYPGALRRAVLGAGGVAQVAGGVPAMCDGITQGRAGMELSLFSREVIAMATAISLAHDTFDGALLLGICDKIVPGLLIGALSFGHLPALLVPAGPMPSGLSNAEKSRVRQLHAEGRVGRAELLEAEAAAYHSPGTCTFYGTANSNQLLVEAMGLQLPGSSFVNPGTDLRAALTAAAGARVVELTALGDEYTPIGRVVDERALVNGVVALLASGGSTNHTMHLVAIAAAAGIELRWEDFAALSPHVPLLARIYPNGSADVNHFHAAGGTAFLFSELLEAGLMHADATTVAGDMTAYVQRPELDDDGRLTSQPAPEASGEREVLRPLADPFAPEGGLRLLRGNLGRAIVKTSALADGHRALTAPARVFDDQAELLAAFERGELEGDLVAVVRYQGPRANGMPELHKLTPALGVLLDRGQRVALVTDGRMSGASGKVPAAIHCTPEAAAGGPLSLLRDGDLISLDSESGALDVVGVDLEARAAELPPQPFEARPTGTGRELFARFRESVGPADAGASVFDPGDEPMVAPAAVGVR
ncbi:MAG TPA: phosphogluconate dehydratase [Solirubrobacterales bacterium]|nr:phosphogluconate dehydratase [Solirubrobacterales bacterium]